MHMARRRRRMCRAQTEICQDIFTSIEKQGHTQVRLKGLNCGLQARAAVFSCH